MIYRDLCNEKVSQLGFGCMRFPTLNDDTKNIDKKESSIMLKEAIDRGINYLDTAWTYHGENSELFVGEFLKKNNLRNEVFLTTKLPAWLCDTHDKMGKFLDKQLGKLQTDYLDFYLLHSLDINRWNSLVDLDVEKFINESKALGKVKHLGFSFHDSLDSFKTICDSNLFDFCQIQLNYMDIDYQAGMEGLKYAKSKGLPVIIMEPNKGGRLAFELDGQLQEIWNKHQVQISPVKLAMKYLYNMPEVNLVLSGMSTMDQVKENIDIASTCDIGDLTNQEDQLIQDIRKYLNDKTKVDCTQCKYCSDCPQEIPIDTIFNYLNTAYIYDAWDYSRDRYQNNVKNNTNDCIECGQCEEQCPQHIEIIKELKESHKVLS